ncbi:hypothetical protein PHYPSEUDO_008731 [Phytophthora pseudosyringae]|uniref:RxLR effector protein n=1 Tax=Phytophthora pseudosyringae TaxID=221518 RepID=A0A8T1VGF6_9STRA|nr:hypothetical protein PHYPSEUDO_008731 [Phytophthora pseudosyringae]
MGRPFVFVVLAAVYLVANEALSSATHFDQLKVSKLTSQVASPTERFLRTANSANDDDEERGLLGTKSLMMLSKQAEKLGKHDLSKKLEHHAWIKAGESPTSKFKEYGWKDIPLAQLREDPKYLRYEGFDEHWLKVQHEKGTIHTTEAWIKLAKEELKKATA